METARIAQILDEMGTLLEVRGENPFRCRAYHNAAQALMNLPADLSEMIADGSLAEVPGHRRDDAHEDRRSSPRPASCRPTTSCGERRRRAWSRCCGSRASVRRRSRSLHETLKIESLADLRAAAESGQIAALKGFGAKTEAKILEGIAFIESIGRPDPPEPGAAAGRADPRGRPQPSRGDPGRGLRQPPAPGRDDRRSRHPLQLGRPAAGPRRLRQAARGRHGPRPRADQGERPAGRRRPVRPPRRRGRPVPVRAPLLHRLEGAQHRDAPAGPGARAARSTSTPSTGADGPVACRTEADLFAALGLAEIPPELREDAGEIEAAENGHAARAWSSWTT